MSFIIIAIDGPSGVGKSTIARKLAAELSCVYVDTGAMFRCLALSWGKQGCPESDLFLQELGEQTRIYFEDEKIFCDEMDVTDEIRSEDISSLASRISLFPSIREVMKKKQRALVKEECEAGNYKGAVLEGRDIGTVVFPYADHKFFIDASPEIRAERRYLQLREQDVDADFQEILSALVERDHQDKNRSIAPLRAAEDAIIIDTGNMNIDEVMQHLLESVDRTKIYV